MIDFTPSIDDEILIRLNVEDYSHVSSTQLEELAAMLATRVNIGFGKTFMGYVRDISTNKCDFKGVVVNKKRFFKLFWEQSRTLTKDAMVMVMVIRGEGVTAETLPLTLLDVEHAVDLAKRVISQGVRVSKFNKPMDVAGVFDRITRVESISSKDIQFFQLK